MPYNSTCVQNILVTHWNAQGSTIESTAAQLEYVLHKLEIDILLLNETFLKPYHKFKLGCYKIYRDNRFTLGGGVLISIKTEIEHTLMPKI